MGCLHGSMHCALNGVNGGWEEQQHCHAPHARGGCADLILLDLVTPTPLTESACVCARVAVCVCGDRPRDFLLHHRVKRLPSRLAFAG